MIVVFSTLIIQKIGANYLNRYQYILALENWFFSKLKKFWYFFIPVIIITPFMPKITNLSLIPAYVIFPSLIVSVISYFYYASLQGLRLFFWTSLISTVAVLFKLGGALAVSLGIDGIATIIVFLVAGGFFCLFLSIRVLHRYIKQKKSAVFLKFEQRILKVITDRQVIVTGLSILAMTVFNNFDIIFVKKYFPAAEAGIYSSWVLFAKIILYAVGPIIQVSFIFFATTRDAKKQDLTLKLSLIVLVIVGLAGYFFYNYFGQFIIDLFFGTKFDAVIPYLRYAAVFGSFFTAINLLNYFFLAKGAKQAITLAVLTPFYVIGFFIIPRNLMAVINLNIGFSIVTAAVYLVVYLRAKRSFNS